MRGSGGGVGALRVDPEAPWDGMSHANSLWERREVGGKRRPNLQTAQQSRFRLTKGPKDSSERRRNITLKLKF